MLTWIKKHQLISFFFLTYLIAFATTFTYISLKPGDYDIRWSLHWFLNAFSPTIAAFLISLVVGGWKELSRTFGGFLRWRVGSKWYLAAAYLLWGPLLFTLIYLALGFEPPGMQTGLTVSAAVGQLIFNLFSGPLSEEAGWRGFALPRLQQQYNALVSSLILGVIWCCWHIPLYFLPGSSQRGIPFPIYLMMVVTLGVYFTWLYNNTRGSLIITVLAHFCFNVTGGFIGGTLGLLPPMVLYVVAGSLLLLSVVLVVIIFKPARLSMLTAKELSSQGMMVKQV
jgi:CAAX protease family protein